MDDLDSKIRERAHKIWEQEGRPDGRAEEHWCQAERDLGVTQTSASGKKSGNGVGKPRTAKLVAKSAGKSPAKSQESGQRR